MVAAYGSLIMHLLVNAMDPHKVCTEIKFCTELTQNRGMFGLFRDEIRNKQQIDIDAAGELVRMTEMASTNAFQC